MGAVLVLGGTSEIGGELASRLAGGRPVVLASRSPEAAPPLEGCGAASVESVRFDAAETSSLRPLVNRVLEEYGAIDYAIVAFGILGDQRRAEYEESHAVEIATTDYVAQIVALTVLADALREHAKSAQTRSTIVAFSSIAGWRARRANYVYGSTKAGLDAFCQGLADALHRSPVRLITARPGFVIGHMTKGMKPAPMSVHASDVADAILGELEAQESAEQFASATLWIPKKLRLLAYTMRLVPRWLWRRMPR